MNTMHTPVDDAFLQECLVRGMEMTEYPGSAKVSISTRTKDGIKIPILIGHDKQLMQRYWKDVVCDAVNCLLKSTKRHREIEKHILDERKKRFE
jgi:hypothetical protein